MSAARQLKKIESQHMVCVENSLDSLTLDFLFEQAKKKNEQNNPTPKNCDSSQVQQSVTE